MIQAPFLGKGDTIGIVAMARKISKEELNPAIDVLKKAGFNVVLGRNIFEQSNQFAGTDAQRAADLQLMLDDPQIKAIISARGGYGTVRIIDLLDFSKFKKYPKWIIGYSDITVLHSHLHSIGFASIHATMPINFMVHVNATQTLLNSIYGKNLEYQFAHKLNKTSRVTGTIIGGNLSLLYALSGTPSDIDTQDKILFIEDLDEYLYHIDRMMMQLKRCGKLQKLKALVVGSFSDMKDNSVPFGKSTEEIILDAVKDYHFPVFFGFPAGHQDQNNAIVLGKEICLISEGENVTATQGNLSN